jgi:hypothetical protein
MRTVVIYPGRFHPFHLGHFASYEHLTKQFGPENVFIATSDKQEPGTSPFSFGDKQHMMAKLGVPASRVVRVKNPYQAQEITQNYDPNDTVLIFALSQKDADRFNFAPKKDGSPAYMQPYEANQKRFKPMSQHGYVYVTPTVDFKLPGSNARSASEIRNLYVNGTDTLRDKIIAALYGDADANIRKIWDVKLAPAKNENIVNEQSPTFILYLNGKPAANYSTTKEVRIAAKYILEHAPIIAIKIQREYCDLPLNELKQNLRLALAETLIVEQDPAADYLEEKWSAKYKRSINCNRPRGFSQRAHCQGRKK